MRPNQSKHGILMNILFGEYELSSKIHPFLSLSAGGHFTIGCRLKMTSQVHSVIKEYHLAQKIAVRNHKFELLTCRGKAGAIQKWYICFCLSIRMQEGHFLVHREGHRMTRLYNVKHLSCLPVDVMVLIQPPVSGNCHHYLSARRAKQGGKPTLKYRAKEVL